MTHCAGRPTQKFHLVERLLVIYFSLLFTRFARRTSFLARIPSAYLPSICVVWTRWTPPAKKLTVKRKLISYRPLFYVLAPFKQARQIDNDDWGKIVVATDFAIYYLGLWGQSSLSPSPTSGLVFTGRFDHIFPIYSLQIYQIHPRPSFLRDFEPVSYLSSALGSQQYYTPKAPPGNHITTSSGFVIGSGYLGNRADFNKLLRSFQPSFREGFASCFSWPWAAIAQNFEETGLETERLSFKDTQNAHTQLTVYILNKHRDTSTVRQSFSGVMSAHSPTEANTTSAVPNLQVPQLNQPSTLSRPFRSRKNRPCDACRKAKTRCAIPNPGPPCVECQQTGKQCTFDELPPVRKRAPPKRQLTPDAGSSDYQDKRPRSHASTPVAAHGLEALMHAAAREREQQQRKATKQSPDVQPVVTGFVDASSLDMSISDVLEPSVITALLTDDLLPIGSNGYKHSSDGEMAKEGHVRQISKDKAHPQYIIFSKRAERLPMQSTPQIDSLLNLFNPPPTVPALITLYLTASNPAFPLFIHPSTPNPSQPYFAILDPVVGAKAAFTALSHSPLYRSAAKTARQLLFTNMPPGSHGDGRLSGLACSLLDLSARDKDVRTAAQSNYLTMAMTIAQAQLLGLHIDCTSWSIPEWEKDLRRTLWWSLKVHDAWMSFLNSRPSHIQRDNTNVALPTLTTILHLTVPSSTIASPTYHSPTSYASPTPTPNNNHDARTTSAQSFIMLCRLSMLVSNLQARVCTLGAAGGMSNSSLPGVGQQASREERLRIVGVIEGDAAALLDEVQRTLGGSRDTGVVSLMTCIFGFRCMLRRIFIELNIGLGCPFTPDSETLNMYADAVDYVCGLEGPDFDGFWLTYVSHVLSSLTSSLIRLSLATSTSSNVLSPPLSATGEHSHPRSRSPTSSHLLQADMRTNPLALLSRLMTALIKAKYEAHWEMADASLARAKSVSECLRATEADFNHVTSALEGRFEPPIPPQTQYHAPHQQTQPHPHPQMSSTNEVSQQQGYPYNPAWNIDLNVFGVEWMDGLMTGNNHTIPQMDGAGNGGGYPQIHMQGYGAR